MQIRNELEQIATTWLAVLCGKVAEDPTIEHTIAKEARELKQEWTLLEIPAPIDYVTKEELKTKEAVLRPRMIELLSHVLKGL